MVAQPDTSAVAGTRRHSRRRAVRIAISLLVAATFIGIPFARMLLAPDPVSTPDPPRPVVSTAVIRDDAERIVRYSGNLTPEGSTTILSRVSGRITELPVRENAVVSPGDVIARIEDDVLQLQLAQARSAFEAADAQYRQAIRGVRSEELQIARADADQASSALETARSNLERSRRLFEAEAVSRREYEEAIDRFRAAETRVENAQRAVDLMAEGASEEELTMARANADAAERQLELVQLQLDYATVRTPVGGTVARVLAEAGRMVGPETPLAVVVNDRLIYARMQVPERLYESFLAAEGRMPVRVHPEAYPRSEPFVGTVSSVATVVDASSRTFQVEVAIPNADGRLRPGMYVNAVFVLESLPRAMQVPDAAIFRRAERNVVFAIVDGEATAVAVEVLDVAGPMTVVTDGLAGDERIIVEGAAFLSDGDPVEVVDAR